MSRERLCRCCGGWHKLDAWPHNCLPERVLSASDLPSPSVIADTMNPVQSMLDGKLYDSKAALRSTYKAAGMVEVGNDSSVTDPKPYKRPPPDRQKIKAAVHGAFSKAGLGA